MDSCSYGVWPERRSGFNVEFVNKLCGTDGYLYTLIDGRQYQIVANIFVEGKSLESLFNSYLPSKKSTHQPQKQAANYFLKSPGPHWLKQC